MDKHITPSPTRKGLVRIEYISQMNKNSSGSLGSVIDGQGGLLRPSKSSCVGSYLFQVDKCGLRLQRFKDRLSFHCTKGILG
jgi:hypothetical protein